MSTAVDLIVQFAETVGQDIHDLRGIATTLESNQGDLTTLTTTQKATLVGAINELKAAVTSIPSDVVTRPEMTTAVNDALNGIIDGAPQAWDTFKEFADYVAADQTAATAMLESLAKRVRVDAAQTFTVAEKDQGCENLGIGAVSTFAPKTAYEAKRDAA